MRTKRYVLPFLRPSCVQGHQGDRILQELSEGGAWNGQIYRIFTQVRNRTKNYERRPSVHLAGVDPFGAQKQLRRSSLRQLGDRPSQHRRTFRRIADLASDPVWRHEGRVLYEFCRSTLLVIRRPERFTFTVGHIAIICALILRGFSSSVEPSFFWISSACGENDIIENLVVEGYPDILGSAVGSKPDLSNLLNLAR